MTLSIWNKFNYCFVCIVLYICHILIIGELLIYMVYYIDFVFLRYKLVFYWYFGVCKFFKNIMFIPFRILVYA